MKTKLVQIIAIIAFLYLANIGAGIVEIIPDNLPAVGNIDEFAASAILLTAVKYLTNDESR